MVSTWHHQSSPFCALMLLVVVVTAHAPWQQSQSLAGGKGQSWSDQLSWSYQSGLHPHQSTAIQDCLVAVKECLVAPAALNDNVRPVDSRARYIVYMASGRVQDPVVVTAGLHPPAWRCMIQVDI